MTTLSDTAALLLSSLETASREDGSSFLRLSCSAPSWGSAVFMEAHANEFPNDSRYSLISDCLQSLSDGGFDSKEEAMEALYDLSLDLLPCHTGTLLLWFAERPSRLASCDEALNEGRGEPGSAYDLLAEGWRIDCERTLSSLISSLEEERASIFNPDTDCRLLLSDGHGIHIPRLWTAGLTEDECDDFSVDWEDVRICQGGPDEALYWEAWQAICDSAEWEEDGSMWRLVQNGDLWAVKSDVEIPEEWF